MRSFFKFPLIAVWLLLLGACGSGTEFSSEPAGTRNRIAAQGKAVDPYIEGAVFQEMTVDGRVLQRESTPSDAGGNFTFPRALTPGTIIEMKVGSRGFHNGAPYQGILRRSVDTADATMVVSPLTTLVANGATPEEILSFLAAAGLAGMTAADLNADPMAGLEDLPPDQVTDDQLRNLQASMAVNTFFHLLNDYRAGAPELAKPANRQLMADLTRGVREVLNVARFAELAGILAADPQLPDHPMLLGDLIRIAADCMQTVGDLADGGIMPTGRMIDKTVEDTMTAAARTARNYLLARIVPAPGPVPGS